MMARAAPSPPTAWRSVATVARPGCRPSRPPGGTAQRLVVGGRSESDEKDRGRIDVARGRQPDHLTRVSLEVDAVEKGAVGIEQ